MNTVAKNDRESWLGISAEISTLICRTYLSQESWKTQECRAWFPAEIYLKLTICSLSKKLHSYKNNFVTANNIGWQSGWTRLRVLQGVRCEVWGVRCEVRGVMCGVSLCLLMLVWTGSNQDMRILAWWEGCLLHWCCLYWLLYISCTQHSHCTAITWPDVLISQSMIQAVVVCSPTQVHWHFLLLHMIADCRVSCRVMREYALTIS